VRGGCFKSQNEVIETASLLLLSSLFVYVENGYLGTAI